MEITLKNVLPEQDLCDLLGLTKEQIGNLRRQKGLPFIKLTERNRLYFEHDLIEFFEAQRTILEQSVTENESPSDELKLCSDSFKPCSELNRYNDF